MSVVGGNDRTPRPDPQHDPELLPIDNPDDWEVVEGELEFAPDLGWRVCVDLDPALADIIERAAELSGVTITTFIRDAAERAAHEMVTERSTVRTD